MVTVKVQRCPILDYFMAYLVEHPVEMQTVRTSRSSDPRPPHTATLPPCYCLQTLHPPHLFFPHSYMHCPYEHKDEIPPNARYHKG